MAATTRCRRASGPFRFATSTITQVACRNRSGCAITGDTWADHLNRDPPDYAVLPEQPWLDGYCVEEGVVRQFVAMPLGEGFTVEEQLNGTKVHGGVQILAYPMKAARYEATMSRKIEPCHSVMYSAPSDLGLAPGGRMEQEIYDDPYGRDDWDQRHRSRCFVSLVNTAQWMAITGERPPKRPPTAQDYAASGLPWIEYYGWDARAVAGSERLHGLKSVSRQAAATGQGPLTDNTTIGASHVVALGKSQGRPVREITVSV